MLKTVFMVFKPKLCAKVV